MEQGNWSEYEEPWADATAKHLERQGIEPTEENIRRVWRRLANAPRREIVLVE